MLARSTVWIAIATLGIGLSCILAGALIEDYGQSVLLEMGAAIVLVAPLFILERALEARLRETESRTSTVERGVKDLREELTRATVRIADLSSAVEGGLNELEVQDDQTLERFSESPTARTLRDLLARMIDLNVISRAGLRVQVPLMYPRIRFAPNADPSAVSVTVEELDGTLIEGFVWDDSSSAVDVMTGAAEALQRKNAFPGRGAFDATNMLQEIVSLCRVGVSKKRSGSTLDLSPLVERVGEQWAVTIYGLECLEMPYPIHWKRFDERDFKPHVMSKTWVEKDDLHMAWGAAEALHVRGQPDWLINVRDEDE